MKPDLLSDLGVTPRERENLIKQMAARLGKYEFENRDDCLPLMPSFDRLLCSGIFWITEKNLPCGWRRAMIGRHDKTTAVLWGEKQKIKNVVYGSEVWAVECYPPESELSDEGNIYWLHIAPSGWLPEWEAGK